jgi:hypothetical protein
MNDRTLKILVSKIGNHQVTMTNRKAGTMLVSEEAYYSFRKILAARGLITQDDTQSDVLSELGTCIDDAIWLRTRDRNGNLLLLDKDMKVMFIVADEGRILLHSYDKTKSDKAETAVPTAQAA